MFLKFGIIYFSNPLNRKFRINIGFKKTQLIEFFFEKPKVEVDFERDISRFKNIVWEQLR